MPAAKFRREFPICDLYDRDCRLQSLFHHHPMMSQLRDQKMGNGPRTGRFKIANDFLDDSDELETSFQQDGYLFFRQVLNVEQVLDVKRDFVRVLQQQGIVTPGSSEPIWTGAGLQAINDDVLY